MSGNVLYGTAWSGGPGGVGTLFKINTDGSGFTVLHGFTKERVDYSHKNAIDTNSDGAWPETGLMVNGNSLYGIASQGGDSGLGTAFKINTDGSGFTVLHNYHGVSQYEVTPKDLIWLGKMLYGITPQGGLVKFDIHGTDFSPLAGFDFNWNSGIMFSGKTFYGTTSAGGSGRGGTVFKVNGNGTGFKVLHNFVATSVGVMD